MTTPFDPAAHNRPPQEDLFAMPEVSLGPSGIIGGEDDPQSWSEEAAAAVPGALGGMAVAAQEAAPEPPEPPEQIRLRALRRETKRAESANLASSRLEQPDFFDRSMFGEGSQDAALNEIGIWNDAQLSIQPNRRVLQTIARSENMPDLYRHVEKLQKDDAIHLPLGGSLTLSIKKFKNNKSGISYRMEADTSAADETKLADLTHFRERIRGVTGKFDAARKDIVDGLRKGHDKAYGPQIFDFQRDAEEIMDFISRADEQGTGDSVTGLSPAVRKQTFVERLYSLPAHYTGEPESHDPSQRQGVYFDKQGNVAKVLIACDKGAYFGLVPAESAEGDLDDVSFHLGVEIDAEGTYNEFSYAGHYYEAPPFIESRTAGDLLRAFDAVGVSLRSEIGEVVAETEVQKRYGNAYSELGREVAKLVNDPGRTLAALFEDADDLAEQLATLPKVEDPAAQTLLDMLGDVVNRNKSDVHVTSDLPVSKDIIHIRDGSCKDIELYLAEGHEVVSGEMHFYRSSYKVPTLISLQPLTFNGVRMPAGALFAQRDDGFVFMRPSGYSFDDAVALSAFGQQEAENRIHRSYVVGRHTVRSRMR